MQHAVAKMPLAFQKCPMEGVISIVNYQQDKNLLSVMPLGTYRGKFQMFDKQLGSNQLKVEVLMNFSYVLDWLIFSFVKKYYHHQIKSEK